VASCLPLAGLRLKKRHATRCSGAARRVSLQIEYIDRTVIFPAARTDSWGHSATDHKQPPSSIERRDMPSDPLFFI